MNNPPYASKDVFSDLNLNLTRHNIRGSVQDAVKSLLVELLRKPTGFKQTGKLDKEANLLIRFGYAHLDNDVLKLKDKWTLD